LSNERAKMKVFVTDANFKHSLAAIRSLGKKGIYVVGGSSIKYGQSFYSKYCKQKVIYPNAKNEQAFVDFMLDFVKQNKLDVLLPIGYDANVVLSKYKGKFTSYIKIPIANYGSMKIASDKSKTVGFARELGMKTPLTFSNIQEMPNNLHFPVVVKGAAGTGHLQYINSYRDLLRKHGEIRDGLIQEYIPGDGYGFFALFNRGEPRAVFMHRRIREYPITGGASTIAESIYDPKLEELGLRILKALDWHGVAMVEFKKDYRDGEFKLMEVNPKFWGSLDLSIVSGVDFPYLAAKMAVDGDIESVFKYKTGIKFRWLFADDILHLLADSRSIGNFITDFFDKRIKYNLWLNDIKPNLFQIAQTFFVIGYRIKSRKLRYPNGRPRINS